MLSTVLNLSTALLLSFAAAQDTELGGWKAVSPSNSATRLLVQGLTNESGYAASVDARICVNKIFSVEEQVVSGMNYRFIVNGCANQTTETLGLCVTERPVTVACATSANYSVTIYEQSWTDTLQVTEIALLSATQASITS